MTNIAFPNIVPPNEQTKFETYSGYEWAYRLTQFVKAGAGGFIQASYVTAVQENALTANRVLKAGTNITIVDGGPKGNIVINSTGGGGGFPQANYALVTAHDPGLTNDRLLTAGTNISITDGGPKGPVTISAIASSFFLNGFTFGYGEPQDNGWIEFTPQTTGILGSGSVPAPAGGGVSPGPYFQHRRLVCSTQTGTVNNSIGQFVSGGGTSPAVWRGNAPFCGGFTVIMSQGIEGAFVSDSRYCVGLGQYNTNILPGPTHVQEPSAFMAAIGNSGAIGIIKDSTDTSLQLYTNDGFGHSTKQSLGILPVASVDWYVISFFANPNDTVIGWSLNNIATGSVLSGSASVTLPPNNKFLRLLRYVDQGPSSTSTLSIALGMYFWQDDY